MPVVSAGAVLFLGGAFFRRRCAPDSFSAMSVHPRLLRRLHGMVLMAAALVAAAVVPIATSVAPASAAGANTTTCTPAAAPTIPPSPDTLFGEGGSTAEPMINELIDDDTVGLGSMSASYFDSNIDTGGADFAAGNADFALSEFPLSSADRRHGGGQLPDLRLRTVCRPGSGHCAHLDLQHHVPASDLSAAFCANVQLTAQQVEGLFTGHIADVERRQQPRRRLSDPSFGGAGASSDQP